VFPKPLDQREIELYAQLVESYPSLEMTFVSSMTFGPNGEGWNYAQACNNAGNSLH